MTEQYYRFVRTKRDEVNCRMPQSKRNRRVTFRWEVMQAVPTMTNLFKRLSLTESESRITYGSVIGCVIMRRARFWRVSSRSLCAVVGLWCRITQPYSTTERSL